MRAYCLPAAAAAASQYWHAVTLMCPSPSQTTPVDVLFGRSTRTYADAATQSTQLQYMLLLRVTQWTTLIKVSEWPLVTWWHLFLSPSHPFILYSSSLFSSSCSLHLSSLPARSQSADDAFFSPLAVSLFPLPLLPPPPPPPHAYESPVSRDEDKQTKKQDKRWVPREEKKK